MGDALAAGDYFAVLAAVPRHQRPHRRPARRCADGVHAKQAAFIVAADLLALTLLVPPGEFGRRHRRRHHPALWHADGRRRPARRLHGLPRRIQALHARPPGGRERGRAWQPRLPPGAADARAAHPPRESHLQHLHRAGAAGRDGQHVRGLPRPAGLDSASRSAWRPTPPSWRHGLQSLGYAPAARHRVRHRARSTSATRRDAHRWPRPSPRAATCAVASADTLSISLDETTTRDDIALLWSVFAQRRPGAAELRGVRARHRAADPRRPAPHQRLPDPPGVQHATTPRPACCATSARCPTRTWRWTAA